MRKSLHVNKKNIDGKLKQRIQTFKSKKKKYNGQGSLSLSCVGCTFLCPKHLIIYIWIKNQLASQGQGENNEWTEEEHMILNPKATLTNGKPTAAPGSVAPDAGQAGSARQA